IAACWLAGTPPVKTSVSVPRLMPEYRVRTSTSPGPGSGRVAGRISPAPGSRSQKALVSRVICVLLPWHEPNRRSRTCWSIATAIVTEAPVPTIRTGPLVGLAGQVVLLALLARTVGLGCVGWLAGTIYGLVLCAALSRGLHTSGAPELLDLVDHN